MVADGWREVVQPYAFRVMWQRESPDVPVPRAYVHPRGLTAMVGREPVAGNPKAGDADWRWHVSVRYGDPGKDGRIPTWDELVDAAHELRPGVCFVVGIPPRSWWMNVHPHVLHLYETTDSHLVAQWRENARGDRPT